MSITTLIVDHHFYCQADNLITFLPITNSHKITTMVMTNYQRKDNNIRLNINKCRTTNNLLKMPK